MPDYEQVWTAVMWYANVISPLFFVVGACLFIWGFWTYRKYRILAVIPEQKIRGIAMGLVEIRGKAAGDILFTSPITHTPCVFRKVQIDSYSGNKFPPDVNGMADWKSLYSEVQGESFYLEDATGRIKVFPRLAELEVPFTLRLVKVPRIKEGDRPEAGPDSALVDYVRATLRNRDLARIGQLRAQYATVTDPISKFILQPPQGPGEHYGTYRVAELCIFQGAAYDVTGTCVENPHPQDAGDRNLIVKGTRELTFVISSKSERATEEDLRLRARRYIFDGASIMVVSFALWLATGAYVPPS